MQMNGEPTQQSGTPAPESIQGLVQQISYPLFECKGWMKLLGVMYIINGAMLVLSIIGIIIAWLPIWIGVLIFQSANAAEDAYYHGSEYDLVKSLSKLKTFFIILGVLVLIGIIFIALFILLNFAGMMSEFSRIMHTR
jgi:hypothetical protein